MISKTKKQWKGLRKQFVDLINIFWNKPIISEKIEKHLISIGLYSIIKRTKRRYKKLKREARKKMKKLFVVMALVLMLGGGGGGMAIAEGSGLTAATFYDVCTDTLLIGGTISIIDFNKVVSFDVGLITEMSSISYLCSLSIDLRELANKFNWSWTLDDKVKMGLFGARDFKNKVYRAGIYIGILLQI